MACPICHAPSAHTAQGPAHSRPLKCILLYVNYTSVKLEKHTKVKVITHFSGDKVTSAMFNGLGLIFRNILNLDGHHHNLVQKSID